MLPCGAWLLIPPAWPRWALMWALAGAMYAGFKWLTWRRTPVPAPPWRHAAYLLAWPGMDAASFLDASSPPPTKPALREWLLAVARLAAGILLLYGLARLITNRYAAGWVGMVGLTMILHFGAFHLLSCLWRQAGINAASLMNRPLRSRSISEFWGKRWNTPFRDLTHRFLFRPATRRLAMPVALLAAFAASGIVHELVISVPAGAGYGGPTLFSCSRRGPFSPNDPPPDAAPASAGAGADACLPPSFSCCRR